MTDVDELEALLRQAEEDITRLASCTLFEPALVRVLAFIKRHPEDWPSFQALFATRVAQGTISWEIVEFCMAELRWTNVREVAEMRMEETDDFRIKDVMAKILAAYRDDWDGRDMYAYYVRKNEPMPDLGHPGGR